MTVHGSGGPKTALSKALKIFATNYFRRYYGWEDNDGAFRRVHLRRRAPAKSSSRMQCPLYGRTHHRSLYTFTSEGCSMAHPYHHALSSVRKWGGASRTTSQFTTGLTAQNRSSPITAPRTSPSRGRRSSWRKPSSARPSRSRPARPPDALDRRAARDGRLRAHPSLPTGSARSVPNLGWGGATR